MDSQISGIQKLDTTPTLVALQPDGVNPPISGTPVWGGSPHPVAARRIPV